MKTTSVLRLILGAALALVSFGLAAHADTLDDIRKAGKIRIAIDLAIPPFGMTDDKMQPAGSDVDLLVVLAADVPITRAFYREWEGMVPTWQGREVDLHFVHLPDPAAHVSGSWAEAAVCGIVLYDRDIAVSRRLIEIRGRIASGELVRRMAQGQPYWVYEDRHAQP